MVGCRDAEIRVYDVPKEAPVAVAAHPSEHSGLGLTWTKPDSWTEKEATSFRLASYAARGEGDRAVDISVTAFPDSAGGLLANINRWRGQLDLQPVDTAGLEDLVTEIIIAGHPGSYVDMTGLANDGDPSRIVGAILSIEGKTWFFKMTGSAEAVGSELAAFRELTSSVEARETRVTEEAR
ncbi:MAG: hypothetical protein DRP71_09590 [Verrucomicrobia bacterium]|nr:MAG: hypothetical protein DRP71_09590 [Verrucomicrobiota bacterium]